MGPNVSLAFQWRGTIEHVAPLERALLVAGLAMSVAGELVDGTRISAWRLPINDESLEVTLRCYDCHPWISTTLDIVEQRFDEVAGRVGRQQLIQRIIALAVILRRALDLAYVFFDEEAEADLDPESYTGEQLFGITVLPAHARSLETALQHEDIQRVERIEDAVVVFRRLDPEPHYA